MAKYKERVSSKKEKVFKNREHSTASTQEDVFDAHSSADATAVSSNKMTKPKTKLLSDCSSATTKAKDRTKSTKRQIKDIGTFKLS